jgi:phosphate transport system substrate-binding protein
VPPVNTESNQPEEGNPVRSRSPLKAASLLLALAMAISACGDSDDEDTSASTPTTAAAGQTGGSGSTSTEGGNASEDMKDLSGDVFVTGSSTVEPVTIRVAESFEEVAPDVTVDVEGPGTGDGFLKFCAGEADIADASRHIKDEEAKTCADAGIEYTELQIGIDGIAVITNHDNDAVTCLSFPDLYALLGPESEGFAKWSQAQPLATELGSKTQFPDAALDITAPGTESGTYDSFIELALAKTAEARGKDTKSTRTDYSSAADDNVIVTNVEANPTTLGWLGFAYYEENTDKLKALQIAKEANGTCVEPTTETIASGQYPLSRPLFIYVNKAKAESNPGLAGFVDHYLEFGLDEAVADTGYVALANDVKEKSRTTWDGR